MIWGTARIKLLVYDGHEMQNVLSSEGLAVAAFVLLLFLSRCYSEEVLFRLLVRVRISVLKLCSFCSIGVRMSMLKTGTTAVRCSLHFFLAQRNWLGFCCATVLSTIRQTSRGLYTRIRIWDHLGVLLVFWQGSSQRTGGRVKVIG
jgi:hypothetical protein